VAQEERTRSSPWIFFITGGHDGDDHALFDPHVKALYQFRSPPAEHPLNLPISKRIEVIAQEIHEEHAIEYHIPADLQPIA
jgi:hypothetical protein